jgi:hypothetical protein
MNIDTNRSYRDRNAPHREAYAKLCISRLGEYPQVTGRQDLRSLFRLSDIFGLTLKLVYPLPDEYEISFAFFCKQSKIASNGETGRDG